MLTPVVHLFPFKCHARPRLARAFSMIELVMVIAIIAILSAIAVPRVADTISQHRVETAADRISRDLRLAREQARTSSGSIQVIFDTTRHHYQVAPVTQTTPPATVYKVDLKAEPYNTELVLVSFEGNTGVIFDGYGVADKPGFVVVRAGQHVRYIRIDPQAIRITRN